MQVEVEGNASIGTRGWYINFNVGGADTFQEEKQWYMGAHASQVPCLCKNKRGAPLSSKIRGGMHPVHMKTLNMIHIKIIYQICLHNVLPSFQLYAHPFSYNSSEGVWPTPGSPARGMPNGGTTPTASGRTTPSNFYHMQHHSPFGSNMSLVGKFP